MQCDLRANELFYHIGCYTKLVRDATDKRESVESGTLGKIEYITHFSLQKAVWFTYEDIKANNNNVVALSDIQEFFREECAQTGTPVPSEHVTRFKRRVHDILPDELTITKHSRSQKLYIAWRENISVHGINLALHAKMGDLKKTRRAKISNHVLEEQNCRCFV